MNDKKYGFVGHLSKEFPSQILVDVAEVCNLACIHCPHPSFKRSHHYSGRYLEPELNAKLVDEVRKHGQGLTQYIRYASAGEPLVHPGICDMLDYAVQHSGVQVTLTTNGTTMVDKRIEKLLAAGVDVIDVSIDACSPETYARIRVNGNLATTQRNVLRMIEMVRRGGYHTRIVVSFVEMPENTHETAAFEAYWRDQGASYVVVRRLHSCSGAMSSLANERRLENAEVVRRPCLYPWERIVLNPRGDLAYCPSDWVHGSRIADYRTTTIQEVWQGEFYRGLRQAHLENQFSGYGFCGQCPDWRATRWPHEGRSYADMMREFRESDG